MCFPSHGVVSWLESASDSMEEEHVDTGFTGRIALLAAALAAFVLAAGAGCAPVGDVSAVQAEAAKPVQRYDIIQALIANDRVALAGTQSGAVLVSADQGRSWQRRVLGPSSLIGFAVCPDGSFVGIDFHRKVWSADVNADNWQAVPVSEPQISLALTCDAQGRWWVAGGGAAIAMSADRGANWTMTGFDTDSQLTAIQFVDDQWGVAVGEFGLVAVTEDGGATWTQREPMAGEFYPYAALFVSRSEGWVSGLAGQILHTRDGGTSWSRQANAAEQPLCRLFLHQDVPHGVGAGGVLARLQGDTWHAVPYPDPLPVFLSAAAPLADGPAVVAGGPGGLLRVIGSDAN